MFINKVHLLFQAAAGSRSWLRPLGSTVVMNRQEVSLKSPTEVTTIRLFCNVPKGRPHPLWNLRVVLWFPSGAPFLSPLFLCLVLFLFPVYGIGHKIIYFSSLNVWMSVWMCYCIGCVKLFFFSRCMNECVNVLLYWMHVVQLNAPQPCK